MHRRKIERPEEIRHRPLQNFGRPDNVEARFFFHQGKRPGLSDLSL